LSELKNLKKTRTQNLRMEIIHTVHLLPFDQQKYAKPINFENPCNSWIFLIREVGVFSSKLMAFVFPFVPGFRETGDVMADEHRASHPRSRAVEIFPNHRYVHGPEAKILRELQTVPRTKLQALRDQQRGSRTYTPEGIANEVCSRLLHGLIHGAYNDLRPRKLQLQMLAAVVGPPDGDSGAEQGDAVTGDREKQQGVLTGHHLSIRHISQFLTALRAAIVRFLSEPEHTAGCTAGLRQRLQDLLCEALSGENNTIEELAERIDAPATLTRMCYGMLIRGLKRVRKQKTDRD
jgi:hypothetical protein